MPGIDPKGDYVGRTSHRRGQSSKLVCRFCGNDTWLDRPDGSSECAQCGEPPVTVEGFLDSLVAGGTTNIVDDNVIHCATCTRTTTDVDKWDPDAETGIVYCDECWPKRPNATGNVSAFPPALPTGGSGWFGDFTRPKEVPVPPEVDDLPEPPERWFETHDNVVTLCQWLASEGHSAYEVADCVEKPWKFTNEYKLCVWYLEHS